MFTHSELFASSTQSQSSSTVPMIYLMPAFSPLLLLVWIRPDVEEAPAAKEDQSESTQSDSDDCIVHGRASGRKVGERLFTFHRTERKPWPEDVVIVQGWAS